jgi:hypothetical protein
MDPKSYSACPGNSFQPSWMQLSTLIGSFASYCENEGLWIHSSFVGKHSLSQTCLTETKTLAYNSIKWIEKNITIGLGQIFTKLLKILSRSRVSIWGNPDLKFGLTRILVWQLSLKIGKIGKKYCYGHVVKISKR